MSRIVALALLAGIPTVALVGCSTAPKTVSDQQELNMDAQRKLTQAIALDPSLKPTLDRSAGYAVFPTAGRGGFIVGGGYGKGVVYEQGRMTGYCDMTVVSAGAKIGGKDFSEIIAFRDPQTLSEFKNGEFHLDAEASAVALRSGAATNAQFKDNVQVFIFDQEGLMADASIGGATFRFTPLQTAQQAAAELEGDRYHKEIRSDIDTHDSNVDVDMTKGVNIDKHGPDKPVDVRVNP